MNRNLILELLSQDGYYILNKKLIRLIGLENSFLLSFFIDKYRYFQEEFFYKKENMLLDTNLTEYSLKQSLKFLKDNNLILMVKKGCPAKNYYSINFNKIEELLNENNDKINSKNISLCRPTSQVDFNPTSEYENNLTSEYENDPTYNNNKVNKNKEIRTNKEIEIDKSISKESEKTKNEEIEFENQNEQKEEETETTEEHSADRQTLLAPTRSGLAEAVKPPEPPNSKKLLKPHRQSKKQSLQSDPNFHHFLEIANRIKTLIESQKRITISNQQVLAWTAEVNKLYNTLESMRGDKDAIHSMFLMINTLNADTRYEDKYKPVIESGKSFREKFIKIEDYYKRRQIEYNRKLQEEDFII